MLTKRQRHQEKSYATWCIEDPDGMKMLDRALEGASIIEKARVRNVLLSFDIEPDHEFYIIFVAIGQLLVLVKEAPENWRSLFDDVHKELKLWSKENFKSLQSIQLHAQTSAELIVVLRQLLDSMKSSGLCSNTTALALSSLESSLSTCKAKLDWIEIWSKQSQKDLASIKQKVTSSSLQLSQMSSRSSQSLSQVKEMSNQLANQNSELLSLKTAMQVQSTQSDESLGQLNWIVSHLDDSEALSQRRTLVLNSSLAVMALMLSVLFLNNQSLVQQVGSQRALMLEQRKEMGWLLEKASRAECFEGIREPDHPQCQQYDL